MNHDSRSGWFTMQNVNIIKNLSEYISNPLNNFFSLYSKLNVLLNMYFPNASYQVNFFSCTCTTYQKQNKHKSLNFNFFDFTSK